MKNQNEVQVQTFENLQFGTLRTIEIDGEPWFVGKDVCDAFGDKNSNRSLSRVDNEDKRVIPIQTKGGIQKVTFVNESGLYSLLFTMQPQKAHKGVSDEYPLETKERIEKLHKYKRWVTSVILPSIRKTGGYVVEGREQEFLNNSDTNIAGVIKELKFSIGVLQEQIKALPVANVKEPDTYTQNIWKKYVGSPKALQVAEIYGMELDNAYKVIYDRMKEEYGFFTVVAIREYKAKYQLNESDVVTPITAVSDSEIYKEQFVAAANAYIIDYENAVQDNVVHSNKAAITIVGKKKFTKYFWSDDSYDFVINTLQTILGSEDKVELQRTIYMEMASEQAWKNSMTRYKCCDKVSLINTNVKYKKKFINTCNRIVDSICKD